MAGDVGLKNTICLWGNKVSDRRIVIVIAIISVD
jgi:hypothetical protein